MICNNCGYHFKSGFTCPLCGKRHSGRSRCPVCQKTIYHGQVRCNNCGNPLQKVTSVNNATIQKQANYNQKQEKTHQNKEKKSRHIMKFPVFQQLEMYDYRKDNQALKQKMQDARNTLFNHSQTKKQKRKDRSNITNAIVGTIFLATISLFLIRTVITTVNQKNEIERLSDDFTTVEIQDDNTALEMAGNYNQNNYQIINGDDVYLGIDYNMVQTNRNLGINKENGLQGYEYLYYEDDKIYAGDGIDYYFHDMKNGDGDYLFRYEKVLPLGQNRFLFLNEKQLSLYENGQESILSSEEIVDFTYDFSSNLIYAAIEIDDGNLIFSIDLSGNVIDTFDFITTGSFYVDNNIMYYQDYDGIIRYNILMDSYEQVMLGSIKNYTVCNDGIVYVDTAQELYFYDPSVDTVTFISDEAGQFNLIGEYILFERYDGDDYGNWYIATKDGQRCSIDTLSG